MSNESKSRIMLWIFILGLCLLSFMAGRAKADIVDNFTIQGGYLGEIAFSLPATQPYTGYDPGTGAPFAAYFPFDFRGGVLGGALEFLDPTFGAFASTGIISYPQGFQLDPSKSLMEQWPFDYNNSLPLLFGDNATPMYTVEGNQLTFIPGNYWGGLTITDPPVIQAATLATPEPSSLYLVGIVALVLALKKLL